MSINDIYKTSIRPLPPDEQLRLASLILGELAGRIAPEADASDEWSDQDIADVASYSARCAIGSGDTEGENA